MMSATLLAGALTIGLGGSVFADGPDHKSGGKGDSHGGAATTSYNDDHDKKGKDDDEAKAKADARAKAEVEAKAKAEANARDHDEAEARAREANAKARAEGEAMVRANEARKQAEAQAEAEARSREAQIKVKAEAEAKAKADYNMKVKAEYEAKVKAEQEAKAKADYAYSLKVKADEDAKAKADYEYSLKVKYDESAKVKYDESAKVKADYEYRLKIKADEDAKIKAKYEANANVRDDSDGKNKADNDKNHEKALICHATSSATNPWVLIVVDTHAVPAHTAHGDILVTAGDAPCAAAAVVKGTEHEGKVKVVVHGSTCDAAVTDDKVSPATDTPDVVCTCEIPADQAAADTAAANGATQQFVSASPSTEVSPEVHAAMTTVQPLLTGEQPSTPATEAMAAEVQPEMVPVAQPLLAQPATDEVPTSVTSPDSKLTPGMALGLIGSPQAAPDTAVEAAATSPQMTEGTVVDAATTSPEALVPQQQAPVEATQAGGTTPFPFLPFLLPSAGNGAAMAWLLATLSTFGTFLAAAGYALRHGIFKR